MTSAYRLAHFNVARLRAPLTDPSMSEFTAGLEAMNALADASPGFVWRLADGPDGDATTVRPLGPDVIVTMSVWDSVESLRAYSYRSPHLDYVRRRREWFRPHDFPASLVLWWVPAGHVPTVEEACARLASVAECPSPQAFTFRQTFPPPEGRPAVPAVPAREGRSA
ncbi:DUF3291 domain-containing protein [Cryptosporangium sp. NPDC051539]|uniref:DUF3291 domain-containing protein n=1 Tax=Cryptosporangium sp. NPDC051539 TaxID=3363962 RepID=UPI0037991BCC